VHHAGTGSVQLSPLIPLGVLYLKSHGSGGIGQIWDSHHDEFSEFICSFGVKKILEIGAGHGKLAQRLVAAHLDVRC